MSRGDTEELRFESDDPTPRPAIVFGLIAVGLAALGFMFEEARAALWIALMPLSWAIAAAITNPRGMRGSMKGGRITVENPEREIPIERIRGITATGRHLFNRSRPFHITIHYDMDVLTIPPPSNMTSDDLFRAINRVLPTPLGHVAYTLADHHKQQTGLFGEDRVFYFGALPTQRGANPGKKLARGLLLATMLTAIVYMIASYVVPVSEDRSWRLFGWGIGVTITAGVLFLMSLANRNVYGVKDWGHSGIVVSPLGIALKQGDIEGELVWAHLQAAELRPARAPRLLRLKVQGAIIDVPDIYDRPISAVYEAIAGYFEGPNRLAMGRSFDEDEILEL